MKKLFSILAVFLFIGLQAQTPSLPVTTVNNLKITNPVIGTGTEDVLVRNSSDGIVRRVSSNDMKAGRDTPQNHGAYGDGVHDDTAAINACLAAGDSHYFYGTYLTSNDVLPDDGDDIFSSNATITRTVLSGNNSLIYASVKTRIHIAGKLTLKGGGKADGSMIGLNLASCYDFMINNLTVTDIPGKGVLLTDGTAQPAGKRGQITNLNLQSNWIGLYVTNSSEYHTITGITASGNDIGVFIKPGNVSIVNGSISHNTFGLQLNGTDQVNDAHGMLTALNINHSDGYNFAAINVTNGESITGCHFYGFADPGSNVLIQNSTGISFDNCIIDGLVNITDTNTPTGMNMFSNCSFGANTTFTGAGSGIESNLIVRDCYDIPTKKLSIYNNKTSLQVTDFESSSITGSGFVISTTGTPLNNPTSGSYPGMVTWTHAYDKNDSFQSGIGSDVQGNLFFVRKNSGVWQDPRPIAFDDNVVRLNPTPATQQNIAETIVITKNGGVGVQKALSIVDGASSTETVYIDPDGYISASSDIEITDNSKGLILKDTVTSTRYRIQVVSGVLTATALP